jgi:hypothetical protein
MLNAEPFGECLIRRTNLAARAVHFIECRDQDHPPVTSLFGSVSQSPGQFKQSPELLHLGIQNSINLLAKYAAGRSARIKFRHAGMHWMAGRALAIIPDDRTTRQF